jgi:hypothetical protein
MNIRTVLNIRTAAPQLRRDVAPKLTCSPAKLRECLSEIGCTVDEEGNFSLLGLLRAVRVNADPVASRRACLKSLKQSFAKAYGKAPRSKARKD